MAERYQLMELGEKKHIGWGGLPDTENPEETLEERGLRIATPCDFIEVRQIPDSPDFRGILFKKCVVVIPPIKGDEYRLVFLQTPPVKDLVKDFLSRKNKKGLEVTVEYSEKVNKGGRRLLSIEGDRIAAYAENGKRIDSGGQISRNSGNYIVEQKLDAEKGFTFEASSDARLKYPQLMDFLFGKYDVPFNLLQRGAINSYFKKQEQKNKIFRLSIPDIDPQFKRAYIRQIVAYKHFEFGAIHVRGLGGQYLFVPDSSRKGKMLSTYVNLEAISKALESKGVSGLEKDIFETLGYD